MKKLTALMILAITLTACGGKTTQEVQETPVTQENDEAVSFSSFIDGVLHLQNDLIDEYSFTRGYTVNQSDDYQAVVEADYTAQQGLLLTKELDLDADGMDELLVIYRDCVPQGAKAESIQEPAPQWIHRFEIYEITDLTAPAAEGVWDTGDMDAQPWSDDTYYCAFLKDTENGSLLCYTAYMGYTTWSDGEGYLLRGFQYDGEKAQLIAEATYSGSAMDDGVPESFLDAAKKLELSASADAWKKEYEKTWHADLLIKEEIETIEPLFIVKTTSNKDERFSEIAYADPIDEEALKDYRITGEILLPAAKDNKTTAASESAAQDTTGTFADRIVGRYSCEVSEESVYTLEIMDVHGNLYAGCALAIEEEDEGDYVPYSFWATEMVPLVDNEHLKKDITVCDFMVQSFSIMSNFCEYWEAPQSINVKLTEDGIDIEGAFGRDEALLYSGEKKLSLTRDDRVRNTFLYLDEQAAKTGPLAGENSDDLPETLPGIYMRTGSDNTDILEFNEDGTMMYYRKVPGEEVLLTKGRYIYKKTPSSRDSDGGSLHVALTTLGYGDMPMETWNEVYAYTDGVVLYNPDTLVWTVDDGEDDPVYFAAIDPEDVPQMKSRWMETPEAKLTDEMRRQYADLLQMLVEDNVLVYPDYYRDNFFYGKPYKGSIVSDLDNKFAVVDIDGDGVTELVLNAGNTEIYADTGVYIFEADENSAFVHQQDGMFLSRFYMDGIARSGDSHNHGYGPYHDTFWPYTVYEYSARDGKYVPLFRADAWSAEYAKEDYEGNAFPTETDADENGYVFRLTQYPDGDYEQAEMTFLDDEEFYARERAFFKGRMPLHIEWQPLTRAAVNRLRTGEGSIVREEGYESELTMIGRDVQEIVEETRMIYADTNANINKFEKLNGAFPEKYTEFNLLYSAMAPMTTFWLDEDGMPAKYLYGKTEVYLYRPSVTGMETNALYLDQLAIFATCAYEEDIYRLYFCDDRIIRYVAPDGTTEDFGGGKTFGDFRRWCDGRLNEIDLERVVNLMDTAYPGWWQDTY